GLSQGEVERRALEGPAAVVPPGRNLRLAAREEVERSEQLGEGTDRMRAGEVVHRPRGLEPRLLLRRIGDILADALQTGPEEPDDGRAAHESARDGALEAFERIALDLDGQASDRRRRAHRVREYLRA